MVQLTNERIDQMLHEETVKKEEQSTILRSIYTRYMRLYEDYFSDIEALNDEKIEEFKKYNEETISLIKYYYLDIPLDICEDLLAFEKEYGIQLLGPNWHKYVFEAYKEYAEDHDELKKADIMKTFREHALDNFYSSMDYIFRGSFGTESKASESAVSMIKGLFFDNDK